MSTKAHAGLEVHLETILVFQDLALSVLEELLCIVVPNCGMDYFRN